MAEFAAKYLVKNATGEVTRSVGDLGGGLSSRVHGTFELVDKKELERLSKELERKERRRRKKHEEKEAERQKIRSKILLKYGIEKRKVYQPTETHSGFVCPQDERTVLLEEESGDDCSPCCTTCFDYLASCWHDCTRLKK